MFVASKKRYLLARVIKSVDCDVVFSQQSRTAPEKEHRFLLLIGGPLLSAPAHGHSAQHP